MKSEVSGWLRCNMLWCNTGQFSGVQSDPKQSQLSSGEHFSGHPQSLRIKLTSCSPSPTSFPSSSSLLWWRTLAPPGTQTFLRWIYILTSLHQVTSYVCLQTTPGWWRWDIPDIGWKCSVIWISKFRKQVISYDVTNIIFLFLIMLKNPLASDQWEWGGDDGEIVVTRTVSNRQFWSKTASRWIGKFSWALQGNQWCLLTVSGECEFEG